MKPIFPRALSTSRKRGFTLIEIMAATAVLTVILLVLLQVASTLLDVWKTSTGKISTFRNARAAFETLKRVSAQTTLNTYLDYVDQDGDPRNVSNPGGFRPDRFARTSELHFLSGPATEIIGSTPDLTPGHAIFLQAPTALTNDSQFDPFDRTLNAVGFYVTWRSDADTGLVPPWLATILGTRYRFRLIQAVEPTENFSVYDATSTSTYSTNWLNNFSLPSPTQQGAVLAEDVLLMILRPRLNREDEELLAPDLAGTAFTDALEGSILSPDYRYDSRAWESGYSGGVTGADRIAYMRNQIPPLLDIVLICADPNSLIRFDQTTSTPPADLQLFSGTDFTDSADLTADLDSIAGQLTSQNIRFRIFRTTVPLKSSKWSNNL